MATLAQLRALQATIGSALDDIERVFKSHNLDFPSLDVPVALAPSAAEALLKSDEIVKVSSYLVAACGQLSAAVHNPFFTLMDGITAVRTRSGSVLRLTKILPYSATSRRLYSFSRLAILPRYCVLPVQRDCMPTSSLARSTNSEQPRVRCRSRSSRGGSVSSSLFGLCTVLTSCREAHILRLLAAHHIIREVRPDVFASNRITSLLDTGKTPEQIRAKCVLTPICALVRCSSIPCSPQNKYDDSNGIAALVPMLYV